MNTEANLEPVGPAITVLPSERQWAESNLPVGVANRLRRVGNCLDALGAINAMLLRDALGKADKEDSGAVYEGLSEADVWGLRIALKELHETAEAKLEEVGNPGHACHNTAPARKVTS